VSRNRAGALLIAILLAAFFLRQYKLLDMPFFGDEVDSGDIALDILDGKIAPFYPQAEGREGLYFYSMAAAFALLGDNVIANRWPSVAWSTLFVALMYVYGRTLFRSRRLGVLAAGLAAALFWPTVLGHVGLRAISLPVVMVPALLALVLILRAPSDRRALSLGLWGGFFAGLAAYTYTAGRGFPAIVVLFLAYVALVQRDVLRRRWRALLAYAVLMLAVSAWLYIYLRLHPAYDARIGTAGVGLEMLQQGDYRGFWTQIVSTLGMFTVRGEPNPLWNVTGRPAFAGPEGWLFYAGLLLCLWRVRRSEYALQLIVLVTMLVPSVLTDHPPSWTRSVGLLPALLVTTALPIEWAWSAVECRLQKESAGGAFRPRYRRIAVALYGTAVLGLGLGIYGRTASDLFTVWINHPEAYWMAYAFYDETARYVDDSPTSTPLNFVMDWYVPWRRTNLQRPIWRRDVQLRWTIHNALVFPDDPRGLRVAFQILAAPPLILQEAFFDPDAPIYVGTRPDPQDLHPLRIYHVPRARLDEHLARAGSNPALLPGSETPLAALPKAGDLLQFLGYEIVNPDARAGDDLYVFTYWQVLRPFPELAVFVHLLSGDGQIVAQYDGFDVVRADLAPGDTVVQMHTLPLPDDLGAGEYRLELGAYTRDDLQRIPLSTGTDHLDLGPWQPPHTP
jgi:4-amino-4-deoxy-L-arabinose transferase-like glycosyltransferase